MYPTFLKPTTIEIFIIEGKQIEIPKCVVSFKKWNGESLKETFGGKPIVSVDNTPMFVELAILSEFVKAGWNARWIETYGKSKSNPIYLSTWIDDIYSKQTNHPIEDNEIIKLLTNISCINKNSYAGCWDILSWKEEKILFTEAKRNKKDRIRITQNKWLAAALEFGIKVDDFLIVQWEINE